VKKHPILALLGFMAGVYLGEWPGIGEGFYGGNNMAMAIRNFVTAYNAILLGRSLWISGGIDQSKFNPNLDPHITIGLRSIKVGILILSFAAGLIFYGIIYTIKYLKCH
jgi:hypothetical protein